MSSKLPATVKDPRIPPKEVMVTRHKSAQMKRQLRTKNRSMKHLTDLLKSPTKETQTPTKNVPVKKKTPSPKAKQSLLKSVEKIQNLPQKTFKLSKVIRKEIRLVQDEEYRPDKSKRKLAINKVVLKPKIAMKVVGEITGSVKRKYTVPQKASNKTIPRLVQQVSPELKPDKLSMTEAIRIMDERLTDEDLMEILTCPSPVWWEDPPDEHYIEDALFTQAPTEKKTDTPPKAGPMELDLSKESDTDKIVPIPDLSAKSDKFLIKRSKLEDLLGSIKQKGSNSSRPNKEKTDTNKNTAVSSSNVEAKANEEKEEEFTKSDRKELNVSESDDEIVNKGDKKEAKFSESDDEIVFHNSSMNEDELLKDLENMDIPIADQDDVIVIDDEDDDFLDKPTIKEERDSQETKIKDEITGLSNVKKETPNEISTNAANEMSSNVAEVPKNLPALQKCNYNNEIASPNSTDSLSSKSSATSLFSKDIDTISDTNVRFVLDDEIEESNKVLNSKMETKVDDNEIEVNKTRIESKEPDKSEDDSVTIYKIIEDISEPIKKEPAEKTTADDKVKRTESKIHAAYKKCIKVYQKRMKKDTDLNKNELNEDLEDNYTTMFCDGCKPNFKKVSDDENVKYCLNCSSIFDSQECTYCIYKSTKAYTCVPCKIKFCCKYLCKMHEGKCKQSSCREELAQADGVDTNIRVVSFQGHPVT